MVSSVRAGVRFVVLDRWFRRSRFAFALACITFTSMIGAGCSGPGGESARDRGDREVRGGPGSGGHVPGLPSEALRSSAIGLDRRVRLIEPLVGRVRAEPGSTVLVPVRLVGPIEVREPIRLMVVRPGVVWTPGTTVHGTEHGYEDGIEDGIGTGVAYATLHRWSVTGGGVSQPAGPRRVGIESKAARWLGLTGVWSVMSAGSDPSAVQSPRATTVGPTRTVSGALRTGSVGSGSLEVGQTGGVGAGWGGESGGGWLLAINVPWSEDQERTRREVVFPSVLLEVRGLTPRSRSLERLRQTPGLGGEATPGFDAGSSSAAELLAVLRSWPTERWRATLLTLESQTPSRLGGMNVATGGLTLTDMHTNTDNWMLLGGTGGDGAAVLEALSQQVESSWLAALAWVARVDSVLASRLRDRLVMCVRGLDGVSLIPAWPTDSQSLDQLLDDLLDDAIPAHRRLERARGWLEMQPSVAAWVTSDAYAVGAVDHHPVSGVVIAALTPTAGSFQGSRAGAGVSPAVLALRAKSGDGASARDTGAAGAWFVALDYARMVSAEVELPPTSAAERVFAGGRESPATAAGVSGDVVGAERLEFGGAEGRAARAAMDAGIGDVVEMTSGDWSMSRRVWGRAFPVTRPGVTLGPWRAESRMVAWLHESTNSTDDRAVELGFGPVSGIAGLPGRTGASGGSAGTVGNQNVHDPGWVTAARIYRDPQRPNESGWVIYIECRGVGDDAGERGAAQRSAVVRTDTVRVIFGPGAGASHIIAVTEHGVEASFLVPTARTLERQATVVRHTDGWSAWIDVPSSAIDTRGILRVGFERVDARGVRTTWPRTCTPWCDDPGRASFDLRVWADVTPGDDSPMGQRR